MPSAEADPRLALRRRLAELGVPLEWVPADVSDAPTAVRQVLRHLPSAPPVPSRPGHILAIVGPLGAASRAAEAVRAHLGIAEDLVWRAARDALSAGTAGAATVLTDPWRAAATATSHRMAKRAPAVVVVATDDDLPADPAIGDILAGLRPDACWRVVDASRKTADTRARLRDDEPAALVVTGARTSGSPATVWELGAPIAVLDGELATAPRWEAVLLAALAAQEL